MKEFGRTICIVLFLIMPTDGNVLGATTYSAQFQALAPNAGGQIAYSLRRATDESEWGVLANTYLTAGDYPLLGALYAKRLPICDQTCFWQFYIQAGAGVTTAGPVVELLWGTNLLWILRLDVASHFIITRKRVIIWSYPLWLGISMPLF